MTLYRQAVRPGPGGTALEVHVVPRSRRPGVDGMHGDALRLRVAAPPAGGRANLEVVASIASLLGVRARDVEILAGGRSRTKTVHVRGLQPAQVLARLAGE